MYMGCQQCDEEYLGIDIGTGISIVGGLFGTRTTGATVYREDGARWSAKKQYWEDPPGTKAKIQSPKPSGPPDICSGAFACLQSMSGGPVLANGGLVQMPKGAAAPTPGVVPRTANVVPSQSYAYPTGGPVVAGLSTGPLLLAGAAAVAIFALSRRR